MTKSRPKRPNGYRTAYIEASVDQIHKLLHPNPAFTGPRQTLPQVRRWPSSVWTIITVTIARTTDPDTAGIPESAMQPGQECRLIHYLQDHPATRDAVDSQLYESGYRINYPEEEES